MKLLYLDCFSGISGDMWLSSLLDLGLSLADLSAYLDQLGLQAELQQERCSISGISASRFLVKAPQHPPLRHLHDIEEILTRLNDATICRRANQVFSTLAEAEAKVHGINVDAVHFHEIGAVDTIVDVVGVLFGLQQLEIEAVYASPIPWSKGFITIDHGVLPLPAPATAELLCGIPCYGVEAGIELVTPTGAALLKTLVKQYGDLPTCSPLAIGYGAGSLQRHDQKPNMVRAILAEDSSSVASLEPITVLECEVDDMNPEIFSHVFETLNTDPQVKDFFVTSVQMKKNRPGFLLTLLCEPVNGRAWADWLLINTTSLGVRVSEQQRLVLPRSEITISSPWGPVRAKQTVLPDGSHRCKPEYEDCVRITKQFHIPLPQVYGELTPLLSKQDGRKL